MKVVSIMLYLTSIFSGLFSAGTGLLTLASLIISQTFENYSAATLNGIALCRTLMIICFLTGFCYAVISFVWERNN